MSCSFTSPQRWFCFIYSGFALIADSEIPALINSEKPSIPVILVSNIASSLFLFIPFLWDSGSPCLALFSVSL